MNKALGLNAQQAAGLSLANAAPQMQMHVTFAAGELELQSFNAKRWQRPGRNLSPMC
jgi:hypothetical protein